MSMTLACRKCGATFERPAKPGEACRKFCFDCRPIGGYQKRPMGFTRRVEPYAPAPGDSFVYFVEAVGVDRVKIGHTIDLGERLKGIACGCPVMLRVIKTIPGGRAEEKELHHRFLGARSHGEWFILSRIQAEIDALTDVTLTSDACVKCGKIVGVKQTYRRRIKGIPLGVSVCLGCATVEAKTKQDSFRLFQRCPDCNKTAPKSIANISRCRSCAMRKAWLRPEYKERRTASQSITQFQKYLAKPCNKCGVTGVPKSKSSGYCATCAGVPHTSFSKYASGGTALAVRGM